METNTIPEMIAQVVSGNHTQAQDTFDTIMATKVSKALDSRKQEIAQNLFAGSVEQSSEDTQD